MKLISFAVVSLLAITVSAYPGPGTPPQDIGAPSEEQHQDVDSQEPLQHQSTDAQEPQQSYDDDVQDPQQDQEKELEDEIKKLEEQYKDQKALISEKKAVVQILGKNLSEHQESAKNLDENDPNRVDIMRVLVFYFFDIKEAREALDAARKKLKDIDAQRDMMMAELASLRDF